MSGHVSSVARAHKRKKEAMGSQGAKRTEAGDAKERGLVLYSAEKNVSSTCQSVLMLVAEARIPAEIRVCDEETWSVKGKARTECLASDPAVRGERPDEETFH